MRLEYISTTFRAISCLDASENGQGGKREKKKNEILRFRKLTENELDQLLRRLQDTPQKQHVIGFNIWGHSIGSSGCSALSKALPHLSALQRLNLGSNLILLMLFGGVRFHTLQGTKSASPDALRCQRRCRTCRRFKG
jgi:hypothetical protein